MFLITYSYIAWAIIAGIFFLIEAYTLGLTTLWFGGGALVAMILAYLDFSIIVQIAAFLLVSISLLIFTRKIFVDQLKLGKEKTNIDAVIGEKGYAESEFSIMKPGIINILGQRWTAIPKNEDIVIHKGEEVRVIKIEGVKAIVEPVSL